MNRHACPLTKRTATPHPPTTRPSDGVSRTLGLAAFVAAALMAGIAGAMSLTPRDAPRAPLLGFEVVRSFPHDTTAFTQGLVYLDGALYEGTGLRGASSLRKVELETGRVLALLELDPGLFGEGLAAWDTTLVQLTLSAGTGFVYDRATFDLLETFPYGGEGWGLTHDGERLIMSDGSATLRFLDPGTFVQVGSLRVHDGGRPVSRLNELEYVRGVIYANVWPTDRIVRISPATGEVLDWIDLTGLLPASDRTPHTRELNGIAWDEAGERLFVTGKYWPRVFEIILRD